MPQPSEGNTLLPIHTGSLRNVAHTVARMADSVPESLEETIATIPPRMLPPLQKFLSTLAQFGAELRLAFPDSPARSLGLEQLKRASELLEREVSQEVREVAGVFRGVTRESGVFDLKTETGEVFTGTVADDLTEEDLERIDALTNQDCLATVQTTALRKITGPATPTYVLIDAHPRGAGSSTTKS